MKNKYINTFTFYDPAGLIITSLTFIIPHFMLIHFIFIKYLSLFLSPCSEYTATYTK